MELLLLPSFYFVFSCFYKRTERIYFLITPLVPSLIQLSFLNQTISLAAKFSHSNSFPFFFVFSLLLLLLSPSSFFIYFFQNRLSNHNKRWCRCTANWVKWTPARPTTRRRDQRSFTAPGLPTSPILLQGEEELETMGVPWWNGCPCSTIRSSFTK